MAKYKNIKYKGYDSIKEHNRAKALQLLQRAGKISGLQEQVKYELIPAQYRHFEVQGKTKMLKRKELLERAVSYYADFVYLQDGELIVEDVKGMKTEVYKIKRKLMLHVHGIKIKEV